MLAVGTRVIRGPDWRWGEQDSGAGHVGTVVEVGRAGNESSPEKTVVVLWDFGYRSNYRAGYQNAFDLRVVDSAPSGVKHVGLACNECTKIIYGIRWECKMCNDFDLCTPCYMAGKHDLNHVFLRFETENSSGVEMTSRRDCATIELRGIFSGAKVCRGANWEWGNQDGGEGKSGWVVEIQNWHLESNRSVASVTWTSGTNVYRVGHKGQVDLKALDDSSGGLYYVDHLPLLGLHPGETDKPQRNLNSPKHQPIYNVGDKVKVLVSTDDLQKMQAGHGGWNPRMAEFIGKLGVVHRVTDRGDIRVQYSTSNQRWTFHPGALTKVRAFLEGDVVRVSDDPDRVRENQKGHGDWVEAMLGVLGKVGIVQEIYSDGDLRVAVKGQPVWTLNPLNVEAVPVTPEKRNKITDEIKNISEMFGELEIASATGRVDVIKQFVDKHPNNVDLKNSGKTLLQIAAHEGKVNVMGVLVNAGASLEEVDDEGDTALHYAAFGQQVAALEFLISKGTSVDIPSKKQQTTALHVAVIKNNMECVAALLANSSNVNAQDCFGDTPLHDAIGKGYNDVFHLLLAAPNLDLKIRNKRGFNCLQHAALKGNDFAVKKLLEHSPQIVDVRKDDGFAPLHLASLNGHFSTIVTLIEFGKCNVNSSNNRKQTALHLAVNQGEAAVVELLMSHGASPNLQDDNGDTALHIALSKACGKPDYPVNKSNCETLEKFEEKNRSEFGEEYGTSGLALISYLICLGSDLNIANSRKETAVNLVNQLTKFFPQIMDVIKLHSAKPSWLEKPLEKSSSELIDRPEILTPPPSTSKPIPPMNLLECSVCSEQDQNVKFEPCGDVVACEDCASRMKRCLFCHMPISCLVTKVGQVITIGGRKTSTDRLKVLEHKIAEIEEANCCSICMERPRNVVFLCGHSSCDICAQPLKVCHMCRKPITNKINIF